MKACAVLDPWLFTYAKEINEEGFGLKVPIISVSTEFFHPVCLFNSRETLNNLLKNTSSNQYQREDDKIKGKNRTLSLKTEESIKET